MGGSEGGYYWSKYNVKVATHTMAITKLLGQRGVQLAVIALSGPYHPTDSLPAIGTIVSIIIFTSSVKCSPEKHNIEFAKCVTTL